MLKKILFILLIFISGCSFIPGGDGPVTPYNPYRGTSGIVVGFVQNAPPTKVFSDRAFKIGATLSNEGAFNVGSGILVLNYIGEDIEGCEDNKPIALDGRAIDRSEGDRTIEFWSCKAQEIGCVNDERTTDISVTAIYRYQTNFVNDICIDPNLYSTRTGSKTCSPTTRLSKRGQGAPVSVTQVDVTMMPEGDTSGSVDFKVTVQNVGRGYVFGGTSASSPGDPNKIAISGQLGSTGLECEDSTLILESGTAWTMCNVRYSGKKSEYETPLRITLDYVYKQTWELPGGVYLEALPDSKCPEPTEVTYPSMPGTVVIL